MVANPISGATLVTEAQIDDMAGATAISGATTAEKARIARMGEAYLIVLSKNDWVENANSISGSNIEPLLSEYVARYTGTTFIQKNIDKFSSRIRAEDRINVHWARMDQLIAELENIDKVKFIQSIKGNK